MFGHLSRRANGELRASETALEIPALSGLADHSVLRTHAVSVVRRTGKEHGCHSRRTPRAARRERELRAVPRYPVAGTSAAIPRRRAAELECIFLLSARRALC